MVQDDLESDILVPFLGALQASVSVLLVILSGVIAAQFGLLNEQSSKDISKVCVRLFMPALLIVNVGSHLHLETGLRYVAILVWGLIYSFASMLFGLAVTKIFKLPYWVTPAIAFNNTTSLPLLLVQALDATNLLDTLDPSGTAVSRAKSYFLMNSMVGNSLTFALGPKLLNGFEEDAEYHRQGEKSDDHGDDEVDQIERQQSEAEEEEQASQQNEETSLLPRRIVHKATKTEHRALNSWLRTLKRLPVWLQEILVFIYQFVNPPVIGALIGATVGLVPALHRLFFNSQEHGGYFNAWLTSALRSIGDLFAALQVVVVGVKLSPSLVRMRKGEPNGEVGWRDFTLITTVRFLIWPAISISVIYVVATRTNWLGDDPLLWFVMMLMPTGPSALMLIALVDLNGSEDMEKMSIAKFLTITYAISPIIFLPVVGALKAAEAAVANR